MSYYECMCPNKILYSYVVVVSGGLCVVTVTTSLFSLNNLYYLFIYMAIVWLCGQLMTICNAAPMISV